MATAEGTPIRGLTVATYNIHGCVGTDGRHDPDRTAEVIRGLAADVVALQEVDSRPRVGSTSFELARLAAATGLTAVAGPNIREARGEYGNALLVSRPVLAVRRHDLSITRCEPRGALDVEVDVEGEAVRVITTHLGLRASERRPQIARLLEIVEEAWGGAGRPLVLLGDFNEWFPASRTLRMLRARLGRPAAPLTFPSRRPLLALDRVWAVPDGAVRRVEVLATPLARVASDHLPVRARLVWSPGASPS